MKAYKSIWKHIKNIWKCMKAFKLRWLKTKKIEAYNDKEKEAGSLQSVFSLFHSLIQVHISLSHIRISHGTFSLFFYWIFSVLCVYVTSANCNVVSSWRTFFPVTSLPFWHVSPYLLAQDLMHCSFIVAWLSREFWNNLESVTTLTTCETLPCRNFL